MSKTGQLSPGQDTSVVTESGKLTERSPFGVGFSISFGAVTLALLVVTAMNNMDSIAARLVPEAGESVAKVAELRRRQSEPSATGAATEQLEPTDVGPSTESLESSRFGEVPPIDASEPAYEVEDYAADYEDFAFLEEEGSEEAGTDEAAVLLPPISEPEPEPEIVERTEPQLIRLPRPRYPMAARRQALKARVRVKVLIGVDGSVKEVKLAGRPVGTGFDEAALTAAKDTRWMPATENEVFIESWDDLVIEFEP